MRPLAPGVPSTVLVVDDDLGIREALAEVLREDGFHVLEAADGEQALALLKTAPDATIVLLDLLMPRLSGFDVLRELASQPDANRFSVIVMSASEDLTGVAAKPTVVATLRKPFDLWRMLGLVRDAAGRE